MRAPHLGEAVEPAAFENVMLNRRSIRPRCAKPWGRVLRIYGKDRRKPYVVVSLREMNSPLAEREDHIAYPARFAT
jgi:hypothetical protein